MHFLNARLIDTVANTQFILLSKMSLVSPYLSYRFIIYSLMLVSTELISYSSFSLPSHIPCSVFLLLVQVTLLFPYYPRFILSSLIGSASFKDSESLVLGSDSHLFHFIFTYPTLCFSFSSSILGSASLILGSGFLLS